MKAILICLLLPILINTAVIPDTCLQYTYPNTKILCLACRDGYYLKYGLCFLCQSPLPPECIPKTAAPNSTTAPSLNVTQNAQQSPAASSSQQSSLQNCKQINKQGKCTTCFGIYKLNEYGQCVAQRKSQDLMINCLVFVEVQNKCLLCQDNFIISPIGSCILQTSGQAGTSSGLDAYAVQSNLTSAQSDKSKSLNVLDSNHSTQLNATPYSQSQIKKLSPQNQLRFEPAPPNLNYSSLDLKPIDPKQTPLTANTETKSTATTTNPSSDISPCLEYNKDEQCTKCKQGNILNTLTNVCVSINKPIQLQQNNKRVIQVWDDSTGSSTSNSTISNNSSSRNLTNNDTTSIRPNTTNTSIADSTAGNKIIQTSPSPAINATAIPNTGASSGPIQLGSGRPNINPNNTSAKNNSNLINTNTNANTNTNTNLKTNNNTNTTTNTNVDRTSSITNNNNNTSDSSRGNSSLSSSNNNDTNAVNPTTNNANPPKYNITIITDPKTGTVVKIIGTTRNPPVKIPQCLKYRDITYECVQCESTYTLYTGKCLDSWDYEQATKNKKVFYNIPGSV